MKKIAIIILLAAFIFSGCEKDLDLYPLTELTSDSFYKTENDFKLLANGLYEYLPQHHEDPAVGRDGWSDLGYTPGNRFYDGRYIESESEGDWDAGYAHIRRTNEILEAVEAVEDEGLKSDIQQYKGEALWFRAFEYWKLLHNFGNVIIIDKVLTTNDPLLLAPNNTMYEVADFILNDLEVAENLPLSTDHLDGRITKEACLGLKARVALFIGTWAKYHDAGVDYNSYLQTAADASGAIIDGGKFELFDRRDVLGEESYRYFFTLESEVMTNPVGLGKEDQNESILSVKFNRTLRNRGFSYVTVRRDTYSPTKKMMDMYLDETGLPITHANTVFEGHGVSIDPVTKVANNHEYNKRDPRMRNNHIQPFQQFWYDIPYDRDFNWTQEELLNTGSWNDGYLSFNTITGYSAHKWGNEIGRPIANDYYLIRLAEMMLICAEAKFELNGQISDADLNKSINKLRDRVGMPHLTNSFVTSNSLDMLTEIRRERTVELYLEGMRSDDVRRWKTAEVEMAEALKGIKWAGTIFEAPFEVFNERTGQIETVDRSSAHNYELDENGFLIAQPASERQFTEKHYLRPLPLRQLLLNENLKQNPGWVGQ